MAWAAEAIGGPAPAAALWVETYGTMIMPDRAEGKTKEIVLTGARNEYVSAQLALRTGQDVEKPFTFEWTALAGADGKSIAKDKVELFRAADIEVNHPSGENKAKDPPRARPLGLFPDALVPLYLADGTNVANSIKPEKDKTLSFWVDIFIPAGTPPGPYAGSITLQTDGGALTVPVKVNVADVEIPADASIPSMYNLRTWPHVTANLDNYVAEIMAHRLQPSNYRYVETAPQIMDRYNPNGKGFVSVMLGDTTKPTPEREKQVVATLKTITAHLKEKKLFEHSYIQLKDEPDVAEIPGMIEFAKMILRELPEWKGKLADTLSRKEGTELDELVTCHVRPLRCYGAWSWGKWQGREDWDKRRAAGQQLWFYVSNNQGTPWPTFDVDTPNVAFEPRVMAWAWWFEKAEGHLYWDLMFNPAWKLNPRFPPGDGQLLYPGDFTMPGAPSWVLVKDIKGPVISRRMKVFRQGIQEWEMLRMAEKKAGYDKVKAIVAPIYTCMGKNGPAENVYDPAHPMWSYEEASWDKARAEVIQLLEGRP
jgi:hypothetical protein